MKISSALSEMIAALKSFSSSAISVIPDTLTSPAEFDITGSPEYNQPETIVFDYLMRRLLVRFPDDITLFIGALKTSTEQDEVLSSQAKDDLNKWIYNSDHRWSPDLDESKLASLVQLIYQTLCDTIGSTQTAQLFLQLYSDCDDIPEISQFPPTLFL